MPDVQGGAAMVNPARTTRADRDYLLGLLGACMLIRIWGVSSDVAVGAVVSRALSLSSSQFLRCERTFDLPDD